MKKQKKRLDRYLQQKRWRRFVKGIAAIVPDLNVSIDGIQVTDFKNAFLRGDYRYTPEIKGIEVEPHHLIDGQHRLKAITK